MTKTTSLNPSELKALRPTNGVFDDECLEYIKPSKSLGGPTIKTLLPPVPQLLRLQPVKSSPLFQRRLRSMKCWNADDFDAGMSDDEDVDVHVGSNLAGREMPKKAEGVKVSFSGDLVPPRPRMGHSTGDLPQPPRCATIGALPAMSTGATQMSKTLDLLPDDDEVGSIPDSDASDLSPLSAVSEDWNSALHYYSPSNTSTQATFSATRDLPPRRGAATLGVLPSMARSGGSSDSAERRSGGGAPAPSSSIKGIQDIPGVAKAPRPTSAIGAAPRQAAQIPPKALVQVQPKVPNAPRRAGSTTAWA